MEEDDEENRQGIGAEEEKVDASANISVEYDMSYIAVQNLNVSRRSPPSMSPPPPYRAHSAQRHPTIPKIHHQPIMHRARSTASHSISYQPPPPLPFHQTDAAFNSGNSGHRPVHSHDYEHDQGDDHGYNQDVFPQIDVFILGPSKVSQACDTATPVAYSLVYRLG